MTDTSNPMVYQAILNVLSDLSAEGIGKNRRTDSGQRYHFRGIDDAYNTLSPLLAKHGLAIIPRVVDHRIEHTTTKGGTPMQVAFVKVEYDFVAADGSKHTACTVGEAMDVSDKSTKKALSAAFSYACFQTFCIPVEGVGVDSELDDHRPAPRNGKAPPPPNVEPFAAFPEAMKAAEYIGDKNQLGGWMNRVAASSFNHGQLKELRGIASDIQQDLQRLERAADEEQEAAHARG